MFGSLNTYMNLSSEAHQVKTKYSCCFLAGYEEAMLHVPVVLKPTISLL